MVILAWGYEIWKILGFLSWGYEIFENLGISNTGDRVFFKKKLVIFIPEILDY